MKFRYETITRAGIFSIYLAGIILLLMAVDSVASAHFETALMLGLSGTLCLQIGFFISKTPPITRWHIPSSAPSESGTDLQVASLFLSHLGFQEAREQNAEGTAKVLYLLADACNSLSPDSESDEQDAQWLTFQLEGMAKRIAKSKAD